MQVANETKFEYIAQKHRVVCTVPGVEDKVVKDLLDFCELAAGEGGE